MPMLRSPCGAGGGEQTEVGHMSPAAELLQAVHLQALALLTELRSLAAEASEALQPIWLDHLDRLGELMQFLESGGTASTIKWTSPPVPYHQWLQFGRLLRDRRNAAGLSRVQLARRAKLSDATIKFAETARHPPSRATLIRLIGVSELKLEWADVPGHPVPPLAENGDQRSRVEVSWLHSQLNCLLTPGSDSLPLVADLARFLNGAGGYVEQTHAYLDHYSAADYLTICQNSSLAATLRSRIPLGEMAKRIVAASERAELQVVALGAGDGLQETQLVTHLMEAGAASIDLCLLDISQPLLSCAYLNAAARLANTAKVKVWALQGNFHHLPLYTELHRSPTRQRHHRLFTMLGGTLATLDHEPRFLRQSLLGCEADDLLLLDVPLTGARCDEPAQIKVRDRLWAGGVPAPYSAWLGGPIWRHCKGVDQVDFHWSLETRCPVPGSYALYAVATVKSQRSADRQFSLFRFGRYEPAKLADCLSELGWNELGVISYGDEHSLRLYRKRAEGSRETI